MLRKLGLTQPLCWINNQLVKIEPGETIRLKGEVTAHAFTRLQYHYPLVNASAAEPPSVDVAKCTALARHVKLNIDIDRSIPEEKRMKLVYIKGGFVYMEGGLVWFGILRVPILWRVVVCKGSLCMAEVGLE